MPVVNPPPFWRRLPFMLMMLAVILPLCFYGMHRLGGGG